MSKSNQMETTKSKYNDGAVVENAVVIQRVFNLPIGKVWRALTEAEEFKKWWGPKGFTCPYSKMEARLGGKYLNCMRGPDGTENWSTGEVKQWEPERKLVLSDHFSDNKGNVVNASHYGLPGKWPDELQITFELEEADGATKLHVEHVGVPKEMHDDCRQGWNQCFDKLEENIR